MAKIFNKLVTLHLFPVDRIFHMLLQEASMFPIKIEAAGTIEKKSNFLKNVLLFKQTKTDLENLYSTLTVFLVTGRLELLELARKGYDPSPLPPH